MTVSVPRQIGRKAVAAASVAGISLGVLTLAWLYRDVLAPDLEAQRERASRSHDVAVLLWNYDASKKRLPAAVSRDASGKALCSWRFLLHPFLQPPLGTPYPDQSTPWNAPAYRQLAATGCVLFCFSRNRDLPDSRDTDLVAVTGPGTAFDGERKCRVADLDADTILLIELADSGVHWMEPGDIRVDEVQQSITSGLDGEGVHVVFADEAVWYLRKDVPLEHLKKFFTIEGAKRYDREEVLAKYVADKWHPSQSEGGESEE